MKDIALAIEKSKFLVTTHACQELKDVANEFIANGGKGEVLNKKYCDTLKECIMPIDAVIEFVKSDAGKQVFGDNRDNMLIHMNEIKGKGAKYCDCIACSTALEVLDALQ